MIMVIIIINNDDDNDNNNKEADSIGGTISGYWLQVENCY